MLTFKQDKVPDLNFKKAVKNPIAIKCFQINEPFEIQTMEGIMQGKKGDWLMVGICGEMYSCDDKIFKKTYSIV